MRVRSSAARHLALALMLTAFGAGIAGAQETPTASDPQADELGLARVCAFLKDGQTLERALRPLIRDARRAVFEVREGDSRTVALGTAIDAQGHVVTKASLLPPELKLRSYDGTDYSARTIGIDEAMDLAVLKVESRDVRPLALHVEERFVAGQILVCASGRFHPLGVGLLSVLPRRIPAESGFLGVTYEDVEKQVRVTQVVPESAAEKAGLKVDDVLRALDETEISNGNEFQRTISRKAPGTRVRLRVQRGTETLELGIVLGSREGGQPESLDGERSVRRAGFPRALQHDTVIFPWQCGGPVLDVEGHCVGINIARAGRTATLALPAADVERIARRLIHPEAEGEPVSPNAVRPDKTLEAESSKGGGERGAH